MIGQESIDRFVALLGPKGVTTDADDLTPWLSDWRGRYHGAAAAMLSPASNRAIRDLQRRTSFCSCNDTSRTCILK